MTREDRKLWQRCRRDMELSIKPCNNGQNIVAGIEAPRSLREAMLYTVLAAIQSGNSIVDNVPLRSSCMRELVKGLQLLGYRVEEISSNTIAVSDIESPRKGLLVIRCGLLPLALILPLAALRLDYGERITIRSPYLEPSETQLKPFLEAVHMLGARAWPGGSMEKLLIIEGAGRKSPGPLFGRIYKAWGPLLAGILMAGYAAGVNLKVSLYGIVRGGIWLESLKKILHTSARVEYTPSTITLTITGRSKNGSVEYKASVPGSVSTTLLASLPILACNKKSWRVEFTGVPREDMEAWAKHLPPAMGYDVRVDCSGKECRLTILGGRPRSLVHTVIDDPDYAYLALAHAALSNSTVSGISVLEHEGYPATIFADSELARGASLAGDSIVFSYGSEKLLDDFTCSYTHTPLCSIAYGYMLRSSGTIKAVEVLDDRMPGLLDVLVRVAEFIEVL